MYMPSLDLIRTSPWLAPFNDAGFWARIGRLINPRYAAAFGAQLVAAKAEAKDCKSFTLRVNTAWPGDRFKKLVQSYHAGQHLLLRIRINGRLLTRAFSVSGIDHAAATLTITVKQSHRASSASNPSVSAHLLSEAKLGDRLEILGLSGEFKLSEANSDPLLMITAGSGITPIKAMLDELLRQHQRQGKPIDVMHIHLCRNATDFIFAQGLQALAARNIGYRLHVHYSATAEAAQGAIGPQAHGRFDPASIANICPDAPSRHAFVCGPHAFARACIANLKAIGNVGVSVESFGFSSNAESAHSHQLRLENAKHLFTVNANQHLLGAIESQGVAVKFGCRIGICMTCTCLKRSGVVENLRTGVVSDAPNQFIQLCTSVARSDLELAI